LTRPVLEAALRQPKLCDAGASIGEIRRLFRDDHVHMALLVSGDRLVTTIERDDVDPHIPDNLPARTIGRLQGRTIRPGATLGDALTQMERSRRRRLAIVDERGKFLGLLCLKRSGGSFCSDADVLSRDNERRAKRMNGYDCHPKDAALK
jgi:predicted transcriptional regulator